jgi:uncharacterized membrane protein HdeD (DUF308 family)
MIRDSGTDEAMAGSRSLLAGVAHGSRVVGLLMIGLGALCMIAPAVTGAPVVIVVGLLLAVAGAVRAVSGWRAWSGEGGPRGFVVGLLAAVWGLALVVNPVSTLGAVSSLVAAYFIADGVVALLFSSRLRDDDGPRAWVWGDAIFSLALGVSMWIGWPLSGLRALGVLIGLRLISGGAVLLRVERGLTRVDAGLADVRARLDR